MQVVIADDDATTQMILKGLVAKMGYEVSLAVNGEEAWDIVQKNQEIHMPCLMLLDWEMPLLNGLQLCQRIKKQEYLTPPYIILVTARTETEDIVEGLNKGADDYICKPFQVSELVARINVAKRTLNLNHELYNVRQELLYKATHDELTGLLNRRAALEMLEKEFARYHRYNNTLHLAICDIDNFKAINDTYGHFIGDIVLKEISSRMASIFRPYDIVSRFGGEEFLIAVNDEDSSGNHVFERLRHNIFNHPIAIDDKQEIQVSISTGLISITNHQTELSLHELLIKTDELLYQAKGQGKNCTVREEY